MAQTRADWEFYIRGKTEYIDQLGGHLELALEANDDPVALATAESIAGRANELQVAVKKWSDLPAGPIVGNPG